MDKIFIIFFLVISKLSIAQNLVPNSSFEDTVYCPDGTNDSQALAIWFNPTNATPDYYNVCANNGGGVPANDWGYQEAEDGDAYIGIVTYGYVSTLSNYREYFEIELTNPLVQGVNYYWCMSISRLDSTDLASNNIGISLTETAILYTSSQSVLPTIVNDNYPLIVEDDVNWTKIGGSFVANGGEKFLTIGNFYSNDSTDFLIVNTNTLNGEAAYYYIDDVYLGMTPCIEAEVEMPNVFTPNNDGVNDIFTFKSLEGVNNYTISILNRWGNWVYIGENQFQWNGTDLQGDTVSEGTYFYILEYNEKERKTGFVQVIR